MDAIATLRRINEILGWPGLLGTILILLAGIMSVTVVQPKHRQLSQLQQQNQPLRIRIAQAAHAGIPATGTADELAKFYSFFDGYPATHWLDKIYAAAAAQNLLLQQGEYRMTADPIGKLARYQISLPVEGSYPQIRRFVAQVLTDVPIAALDDISFKRETVGSPQLAAHIKFTLFLSADSAGVH